MNFFGFFRHEQKGKSEQIVGYVVVGNQSISRSYTLVYDPLHILNPCLHYKLSPLGA